MPGRILRPNSIASIGIHVQRADALRTRRVLLVEADDLHHWLQQLQQ